MDRGSLLDTGKLLQQAPVFEPVLLSSEERSGRIAFLIEVLRKPAFGSRERDEVHSLAGLWIHVPVFLDVRISLQAEPLLYARSFAWIENEDRKCPRIGSEFSLMFSHVVGYAVLRLARREYVHDRRSGILIRFHDGLVKVVHVRACGLRDIDVLVHEGDVGDFLAVLFLAIDDLAMEAHLGILSFERTGRR